MPGMVEEQDRERALNPAWPRVRTVLPNDMPGYAGCRPTPDPMTRLREGAPTYEGEHEAKPPHWPKVYEPNLLTFSGRPGFLTKAWMTKPQLNTKYLKGSASAEPDAQATLPVVPGHPSLTLEAASEFGPEKGFKRSVHGMPGYLGHHPRGWRPDKMPSGWRPGRR
eukprot:CAMPEP_0180639470 /NCGR_PEP_ID=MMETSP1037_2-20121125/45025_1 /TAXON_ID=632150 /ORGANISM="Azadinium spinosum, Strain 3D9" /LENGTH=165 /DNA_ID=CAMNT_0022661367 /DNA_START=53 /DNA_END=547 /DNA_ORIENTATION=+